MLLYVLAALMIGLIWAGTFKFQLPLSMGLAATGVMVLLTVLVTLIRRRRAKAKKKPEPSAEKPPASEPSKALRPALLPEVQAMQAEFSRAVSALKSSKLSRGGRDAVGALPWYLVIGPPDSGKSTALRNSGLKFPYLSNRGGAGRSVGGTRHCDWWLSNEAVFLDAAGRYISSDEDREEWLAFLDTLSKHRPQRPLNGLVVAVSVSELMGVDPQAAGELGQRLRERIDEMTARLRVVVPIYVMVTKCDLLHGFVEMFSDLPRSERGQIWGFTVPLTAQPEAPTELLLKRFDEMTSILEQRSTRRLGQERRLETRERIYQFPQRFDGIRKNLAEFIQPLFLENVFQDTPVMRGVYFTSGTQELRSSERPTLSSAESLLSQARPSPAETAAEGRSFFIWDVLTKIMFQDQKLAVRSSMEEIRQRKRRYVLVGACMAITASLLVLPTVSFFKNRELLRQVRDTIVSVKLDANDDISRIQELEPLQQHLATLHWHRVDGVPLWLRMGLYKGDRLFPLAQTFYNGQLKGILLGRQHERIKQNLELFSQHQDRPDWKPSNESYGKHFENLKMYLLVTHPRSPREPALDELHQAWLVKQMVKHWEDIRGQGNDAHLEQLITRHAQTYIAMLAAEPEQLAFPRDERVAISARRALNRVPLATLELERIVEQANRDYADKTLSDIVGAVPAMRATKKVRGAYTEPAWTGWIRARMDSAFQGSESWVLNRDSQENEESNRAELRTQYYRQYIQEWTDFLHSIRVEEPVDMDQTERLLESLVRGKPTPLGKLFRALGHNVNFEESKPKNEGTLSNLISRALDKGTAAPQPSKLIDRASATGELELTPQDVRRHFAPLLLFSTQKFPTPDGDEELTQLDSYQDQLMLVLNTLLEVRDKPNEAGLLIEKIASSRKNVELLIKSQEGGQALFEQLLLPPLKQVRTVIFRDVSAKKSQQWCDDVFSPFMTLMANRYPFDKSSLLDTPLPELSQFLHPSNGVVKKFIQAQLSEEVIPNGRRWQFSAPSLSGMYKEELLTYLERVNALATTLFPGDTQDPLVRFTVRLRPGASEDSGPSDIASITLTVDGSEELYRNGPDDRWRPLSWPGPAGKLGAHLRVVSTSGNIADLDAPGEWGLFRLLERAKKIEPSADGRFFTATWEIPDLNNAQIAIDIRPERLANPFFGTSGNNTSRLFQIFRDPQLKPPAGIAQVAKDCSPAVLSAKAQP
ncbi:type VI secretion system membrane subunit TssM [Hyalangium rubrum]|uniref:Type VI secretion system membrane subunit TssM n=1 Tax=Hyalangium rubrum TaxID=3103134 RepID=A0ABU5GX35_9BACT|nr:type VI secretion system membrane subunit TssM [Hyalangium sp. s54d21]MDY7225753.1 type VI secretion system membrane subunit TssM [Hyalangium sp. s54d21]